MPGPIRAGVKRKPMSIDEPEAERLTQSFESLSSVRCRKPLLHNDVLGKRPTEKLNEPLDYVQHGVDQAVVLQAVM